MLWLLSYFVRVNNGHIWVISGQDKTTKSQRTKSFSLLTLFTCNYLHVALQNIIKQEVATIKDEKQSGHSCSGYWLKKSADVKEWMNEFQMFEVKGPDSVCRSHTLKWWWHCSYWGHFSTTGGHTSQIRVWCRWKVRR